LESLFSQISSAGPQAAKYRVRRVAQCVYDVLTPQEMVHSHEPEIVSAIFSVHAKWAVYKDEYLTRPPATTPVTIVSFPGTIKHNDRAIFPKNFFLFFKKLWVF
jgi:hypothetical protein